MLRTLIRVDIQIDQDWAVGAAPDLWFRPDDHRVEEKDRTIRLPIQRDPIGGCVLPATSLVGSLRDHLGFVDGNKWLGSRQGRDTVISAVRCLAATIDDTRVTTLITTAIDPRRRAARGGFLRREETLPPGLVTWWLEWDHHDPDLQLMDLIEQLRKWRPVVGRRRSANRGRAHIEAVHYRTFDLAVEADLTWWLAERPSFPWTSQDHPGQGWRTQEGTTADVGRELLRQTFRVVDALHVGGQCPPPNQLPESRHNTNWTKPALPSTSWRGIFRHRVEHIVRVTTPGTPAEVDRQVATVSARLFGSGRGPGGSRDAGHRGQLRFGDSEIVGMKIIRTHVAIERVTGGAAKGTAKDPRQDSGLLFNVEYFGPGATLDLVIFNDSTSPVSEADQALLEAVLRDIDDGVVGVGGMTSRGYGTLQCVGGAQ